MLTGNERDLVILRMTIVGFFPMHIEKDLEEDSDPNHLAWVSHLWEIRVAK